MDNSKALLILRQWVITDAHGNKHPVSLFHSDNPHAKLAMRSSKPGNWQEVEPGSVLPVERPKPQPVPDIPPVETSMLALEYRIPRTKKR
jgi:hypothetical protein